MHATLFVVGSRQPRYLDYRLSQAEIDALRRELQAMPIYNIMQRYELYREECKQSFDVPNTACIQRLVVTWRVMRSMRTHDQR